MDKRKLLVSILAGFMALVMLFGLVAGFIPAKASAASSGELKQQINALKKQSSNLAAEMKKLKKQISSNSSEIEKMVEEKNLIDQEIFLMYEQIENINNQIITYNLLIADKQEELVVAEGNFNALTAEYKDRIRIMEEEGEVSYWSVLFQANDFSDLLDRLTMIQEIAAADRRRLDELNAAAKVVADAKAELQTEKEALEASRVELDATQAELEKKREKADTLLAKLVDKGMEYEAMMDHSEDEQARLMKEIANKKDEYDAAVYREWLATSVPPTTKPKPPRQTQAPTTKPTVPNATTKPAETTKPKETTAPKETTSKETTPKETTSSKVTWKVPIKYTSFTSPYGWRIHPVYGTKKFHYGVDLSAPTGTPIYASRGGTVEIATFSSTAGYYVQINHGDGFRSVYMHMTHYTVSAGQHVGQGEVIGYCGSTGTSTGPHLHFGISKNGSYVNPANYIPI